MSYKSEKIKIFLDRVKCPEPAREAYVRVLSQAACDSKAMRRFRHRPVELVSCFYGGFGTKATEEGLWLALDIIRFYPCLVDGGGRSPGRNIRRLCRGIRDFKVRYLCDPDDGGIVTTASTLWMGSERDGLDRLFDPKNGFVYTPKGLAVFEDEYQDWLNKARYGL